MRLLNVRIGEHIGISPLAKNQVKSNNCSVSNYLTSNNHSAAYDDFSIVTHENKKFLLELKERDELSLNRNITSTPLQLFGWS